MQITRLEPWLKHSERPKGLEPTTIVLHHTAGGSAESTLRYLAKPLVLASYHYLIERDGKVYKCVPVSKKAWHAGVSNGPDGRDVNRYSIGIAFANLGDGEAYPEAQIEACHSLIEELVRSSPYLAWITTHRLITKRKIDPASFDFEKFCQRHKLVKWMDSSLGRGWNG